MKVSEIELVNTISVIPYDRTSRVANENDIGQDLNNTNENILSLEKYKKTYKSIKYINLILKRIIDILGAIVGIILLVPLTIGVVIANFISGDFGPIFYSHTRIGKGGKHFKMYKFRSMCIDSDKKLRELLENNENARREWKENQKLENDPRITKVGKFLRKTSLDEFPQFINVLKGEMSLVGPRAIIDEEVEKFGLLFNKAFSVKPGITGNWAANGRSDTTYDERVILEAQYIDNFSVIEDVKILFKTVESVISMKGAK